jgi:hypothetical protein
MRRSPTRTRWHDPVTSRAAPANVISIIGAPLWPGILPCARS